MNLSDYKLSITYLCAGVCRTAVGDDENISVVVGECGGDRLSLGIRAKDRKIDLLSVSLAYSRRFAPDARVFANGYQSWTVSREYTADDIQRGLRGPANFEPVRSRAQACGDYFFTRYSKKKGFIHSFTYTYIKENGHIELIGSLSERQGYTIIYFDMNNSLVSIEKDVEGLSLDAGEEYNLYELVRFEGAYDYCFDGYFAAMGISKPRVDFLAGYTSWYNYFQDISEDIILRDLRGIMRAKDEVNIFQIDDGYEAFVGDWHDVDRKKFPGGMKKIADKIHENGLLAGLWLAPFSAQFKSKVAKEHPDWLLRKPDGKNVYGGFAWGGFWVLDFYIPEAAAYIKGCFDEVFDEWGFDLVKLDFLYSACIQPRRNKTRGRIMCEAMDFLRECCRDKLILGCGVPLGPSFGVVDACRISCDAELSFKERFYVKVTNQEIISTHNAMTNSVFRRHLSGRAFINDPDVFFLRDEPAKGSGRPAVYTETQKELLATVNNMFGRVLFVSDNAGDYDEKRLSQLKGFLKRSTAAVTDAGFVSKERIRVDFTKDGAEYIMEFDLRSGDYKISKK